MRTFTTALMLLTTLSSSVSFGMAKWDRANAPERMEIKQFSTYERKFEKLPLAAKLTQQPWSDDYWATHHGGITYRWNEKSGDDSESRYGYKIHDAESVKTAKLEELSPAEKFDLFIGNYEFSLTNYERNRTQVMKTIKDAPEYVEGFEIPTWEGLCHAWAPATLNYKEPKPVTLVSADGVSVPFGSSDIKALLTYFLHLSPSPRTGFLGSRCNIEFSKLSEKLGKKEITQEEYDAALASAECSDVNAGAFHIALANQIGLMNEGFVVDVTRDFEVWNQPVFGLETKVISDVLGASATAAPGTVREVTVQTRMFYTVELTPSWNGVDSHHRSETSRDYEYRLELNSDGEIIGGEWIGFERPDFIWKQIYPKFSGYFARLQEIYDASIK